MADFYGRRRAAAAGIDTVLSDMQGKRQQEERMQQAYLLSLISGQPYERQLQIMQAMKPQMAAGMPAYQATPEEQAKRDIAGQQSKYAKGFDPNAGGGESIVGYDLITGRNPNKEFTERSLNRRDLQPTEYTDSVRVGAGIKMNAKDRDASTFRDKEYGEIKLPESQSKRATDLSAQAQNYGSAASSRALAGKYGEETTGLRDQRTNPNSLLNPKNQKPADPTTSNSKNVLSERGNRVLEKVDSILPRVGYSTAGVGSVMKRIPGTPAADLAADLDSLAGDIAFSQLQEMRDASKTGGALGAIAVRELDLLQGAFGSMSQDQSPDNLRRNLGEIRSSAQRWADAKTQGFGRPLDAEGAKKFLQQAGGDKDKARQMARQAGFSF